MAENDFAQPDASFSSLVLTLSSSAWVSMGKIADPITGETKQDIKAAKFSIDILLMLRDKTRGNLNDDEHKLLEALVHDLQANYAEVVFAESSKAKAGETGSAEEPEKKGGEPETPSDKKKNEEV
jgi:hypothetical protein